MQHELLLPPQRDGVSHSNRFPETTLFGAASAPFQMEGNTTGRRHADWDEEFARYPEKRKTQLEDKETDWWTRGVAEGDFETLSGLGLQALRLGVEWARVIPERGRIDQEAMKRYQEMISHMRQLNMQPMITLNHFVLPDWIAKEGSWENPQTVHHFKYFTEAVADTFGDVGIWVTVNEPFHLTSEAYVMGKWPPRKRMWQYPLAKTTAEKNLVNANAVAYDVIKRVNPDALVGAAHSVAWLRPENPGSPLDRFVTEKASNLINLQMMDWMNDHADFIGVNYYHGYNARFNPTKLWFSLREEVHGVLKTAPFTETIIPDALASDSGWPIVPDYFFEGMQFLASRYKKPIIITENGIDDKDDKHRAFYILNHLRAIHAAMEQGIDIKGYFYWSAIDTEEWMEGWRYHFGLIGFDQKTGQRSLRGSAHLYGEIARTHEIDVARLTRDHLTPDQAARTEYLIFSGLKNESLDIRKPER